MGTDDSSLVLTRHAADQRRWLIGIGISVAFGLFGVVMTLLSYSGRSKPDATPAATVVHAAPGAPPAKALHDKGKGHGRE
ncbi:hypothetical protein BH11MYX4_BH11MYX4_18290 [soil metagenome]